MKDGGVGNSLRAGVGAGGGGGTARYELYRYVAL